MKRRPRRSLLHAPVGLLLAASLLQAQPSALPAAARAEPATEALAAADPLEAVDPLAPFAEPAEQGQALEISAAAAPLGEPTPARPTPLPIGKYTVQPGDSLAAIAERFGLDVPTLLGSNEIGDPDLIPTGQTLAILPVVGVLYQVVEGDTLNRIAARYEVDPVEVLQANALADSELVVLGQELILPGARPLLAHHQPAEETTLASLAIGPATGPGFGWPAAGAITTYFGEVGWTSPRGHAGLDIAAAWGAPVTAAAAGRVLLATPNGGPYGYQIIIDHGDELRTVYGHLSELAVAAGEVVERGELIGRVGSTGFSTGPHLHFEIRQHGELRNPMSYLP